MQGDKWSIGYERRNFDKIRLKKTYFVRDIMNKEYMKYCIQWVGRFGDKMGEFCVVRGQQEQKDLISLTLPRSIEIRKHEISSSW